MFSLVPYQNKKFPLVSQSCHTRVVFALLCLTVSHLLCVALSRFVALMSLLSLVRGTRVVKRLDHKFVYFHCTCDAKCRCQLIYVEMKINL